MNRALQLRLDKGLQLTEVAAQTGVSRQAIRAVENEDREPHAATLRKLGVFYGVQPSSLLQPAVFDEPNGKAA